MPPSRPWRAVLFDAGNTLLDLDYPWLGDLARRLGATAGLEEIGRAAARLLRQDALRYGRTPASEDAAAVFLGSFRTIGEAIGLAPPDAQVFAEAARQDDASHPQGLWRCPAPGAQATLAAIAARGCALGVISNSDGQAERHLALAGLRRHLDLVVDSSKVGLEKPDPGIFHLALAHLGLKAAEAIYVGDLLAVDIVGARGAGLAPLLYDRWDAYPDVLERRVRSLPEVLDWL